MKYTAREPEYNFVAKVRRFRPYVLVIDEDKDTRITELFGRCPRCILPTGHHRSAAAALVGPGEGQANPDHRGDEEYNYFMAVCFANQLTIIDYNHW